MAEIQSNYDFQNVIAKFIEKMGFDIDSMRMLDDGSIDFTAKTTNPMGGRVVSLIRASTYGRLVNKNDIMDLQESMDQINAIRAAYITTSGFSEDAVEAARDKPISLINKYQLIDSIEKRGLLTDGELMDALDRYGMAEQHFQGYEQSFLAGRTDAEIRGYFQGKAKKGEKLTSYSLSYAPLSVLKVVTVKDMYTEGQTLRSIEKKDYMFVNLNNLDLYYIIQKRKKNATDNLLLRSDIIKKINGLPDESKEHLLHLLEYGDLPVEDIEGKDLSILKNKKVIEIYEGKRSKATDFAGYAQEFLEGVLETINMVVNELISGISTMGEETEKKKEDEKPKKKVMAEVSMPHLRGGIYDIWKYLEAGRGMKYDAEIDPLVYSSKDVARLLGSIMKGKVRSEGIIFMPYYKAKFSDQAGTKVSKYEVLIAPKFKGEELKKEEPKGPKIKARTSALAGKFRVIR